MQNTWTLIFAMSVVLPSPRMMVASWTMRLKYRAAPSRRSGFTTRPLQASALDMGATDVASSLPSTFTPKSLFLRILHDRGFLHQCTDLETLDEKLLTQCVTGYLGFDATASSLHVGSLLQIMLLRHLQRCGHKPLVLLGGGTTKIGDPSGKDTSRKMLSQDDIETNIRGIGSVFNKFLTFGDGESDAVLVNNDDWLSDLNYLMFLRDYGPHFTINRMMTFDSVRLRLEREQPLTLLEFNYMIFQAYDFLELSRRYKCSVQFGGSDQWGNIINGVELNRRVDGTQVFGLTAPLITTSDGRKMGKSADGAVWLSADLLSPYDYWQFWRNTEDNDVGRFLKLFTDLPLEEIAKLETLEGAAINDAKVVLADECTKLLHGEECLVSIKATADSVFKGGKESVDDLPRISLTNVQVEKGELITDLIVSLKMASSKSEARRHIQGGAVRLNGNKIGGDEVTRLLEMSDLEGASEVRVSVGKKKHGIVQVVP